MDVLRAFTFLFRDPAWPRKALVGVLLMLVPLVGWLAVAGYGMRVMRQAAEQRDVPLPSWSDWRDLLGDGLRFIGVLVVWLLLSVLLFCPLFAAAGAVGVRAFDPSPAVWVAIPNILIGALFGLPSTAAVARAAVVQDAMKGLDVPEVFRTLRRGFRGFLIASLVTTAAGTIGGYLGGSDPTQPFLFEGATGWAASAVAFAVGTFYSALYNGHLTGQAYRLAEVGTGSLAPA
jgi:hypothetical protein